MFQLIVIVAYVDYLYVIKQINNTSIMIFVQELDQTLLTNFVYFLELIDIWTICYFVLILPHIQIYFATAAQVQVFLLVQYVKDLTKELHKNPTRKNRDRQTADCLKRIVSRYCEIKQ